MIESLLRHSRFKPLTRQFHVYRFLKYPKSPKQHAKFAVSQPPSSDYRTTEFIHPSNPKNNIPHHTKALNNERFFTRNKKFLPIVVSLGIGGWALYTIYYFSNPDSGTKAGQLLLSPESFTPFVISNKKVVDEDHCIIELAPQNKQDLKAKYFRTSGFWNGNRLWSVEVKQPEIMVVRKYTPLPLEILDSIDGTVLRLSNDDSGKLCLYIKKYAGGEVAKWISKQPVGSVLELRGPYTEFEIPASPVHGKRHKMENLVSKIPADLYDTQVVNNMAFYAGGTGVAPALQMLLSENPFRGKLDLHYSYRNRKEVPQEFQSWLYLLEKLDRVSLNQYEDSQKQKVTLANIKTPCLPIVIRDADIIKKVERDLLVKKKMQELKNEPSAVLLESSENVQVVSSTEVREPHYEDALQQAYAERNLKKNNPSFTLVCGPQGYVEYISGAKPTELQQGPVQGLLAQKGWNEATVYKL